MPVIVPKLQEFRIRQEGDRVHVIVDGQVAIDLPWQAADKLWMGVRAKTRLAEEYAKRDQIAYDSAILVRAGAGFALSSRPDVKDEVKKIAAHDRGLRRYMPSIKSQEKFGHPVFETMPAKKAGTP